jgi:hypothetical protein
MIKAFKGCMMLMNNVHSFPLQPDRGLMIPEVHT